MRETGSNGVAKKTRHSVDLARHSVDLARARCDEKKHFFQQAIRVWNNKCDQEPTLTDEDKIKIPEHGTLLTYENLATKALDKLDEPLSLVVRSL